MSNSVGRVASVLRAVYRVPPSHTGGRVTTNMVKRISEATVNVEKVNLQPSGSSVKDTGKWRYPNGIIKRGEHLTDRTNTIGVKYTDDREADKGLARRKIESNFFLTLSTNKVVWPTYSNDYCAGAELAKQACANTMRDMQKDEHLCDMMVFGPKSAHYQADKYEDVIEEIEWKAAVEVGEKQKRLHAHAWLTVHHYSQIQISIPKMSNKFKKLYNEHLEKLGVSGDMLKKWKITKRPFGSVKLLPTSDWAMVIRQYMTKAMV